RRVPSPIFRLSGFQQVARQNYVPVELPALHARLEVLLHVVGRPFTEPRLFDQNGAFHHAPGLLHLLLGGAGTDLGLHWWRWLVFLSFVFATLQLLRDPGVHLAGLIDNSQPGRTSGFDCEHQGRHHRKCGHHQRTQDRHQHKKLGPHPLDVLAFDDREELLHAVSFTLAIKMSCSVGSTSSNLVTTVFASINRLSKVCGLTPSARSTSKSSPTWRTLSTSSGSCNSPSWPSKRRATALRDSARLMSRSFPSSTLRERLIMQTSSQSFSAISI